MQQISLSILFSFLYTSVSIAQFRSWEQQFLKDIGFSELNFLKNLIHNNIYGAYQHSERTTSFV